MLVRRNTTYLHQFYLGSLADVDVPVLGAVPTVQLVKAGGTLVNATNAAAARAGGWYNVLITAIETNTIGDLAVVCSAAGAGVWRDIVQVYESLEAGSGSVAFTYTITATDTGLPISGVATFVTTDLLGVNRVASGTSNAFGQIIYYLDPGTYYFWSSRTGYTFSNPDTEAVS